MEFDQDDRQPGTGAFGKRKAMPFLRDVDDVDLYAQMLENVFLLTYEYLGDVLAQFPIIRMNAKDFCCYDFSGDLAETYERLARMRYTMSMQIRDMADRRRRLSDATRGLSDVEFEKD